MKKWFLSLPPILLFAGLLALMQWISGMPVTWLWLKAILVFLATTAVVRLLPWDDWIFKVRGGSVVYRLSLFALFVRHFAAILFLEGRRALTAHALAAPNRYGPGAFRSLAWAISSLFSRSLARAERFYAAQLVRGIGE